MRTQRAIIAGDLVIVTKPNLCCGKGSEGLIFEVESIRTIPVLCRVCKKFRTTLAAKVKGRSLYVGMTLLKRIAGLGELSRILSEDAGDVK